MNQEDLKTINVARAFKINVDPGDGQGPRLVTVAAGIQRVPEVIASHWYTQQHLMNGGVGTVEYATAARAAADNAFVAAEEAIAKYEGLEEAAQDAEEAAGMEVSEPSATRIPRVREERLMAAAKEAAGEAGPQEQDPPHDPPQDPPAPQEPADVPDPAQGEETQAGEAGNDSAAGSAGEDTQAAPAGEDAYPNLTDAQEKALDRDGDGKPGGAPKGGNKKKGAGL